MNWKEADVIHVPNVSAAVAALATAWLSLGYSTVSEQHGDACLFGASRGDEAPHNLLLLPDPPPPPSGPFWFDTFKGSPDGTNVIDHTGEIGASYTTMWPTGGATIQSANVRADAIGNGYLPSGQPMGPNYYVELALDYVGDVGADEASIYLHLVAPGDWSGYEIAASGTAISLYRLDLSARTLLQSVPWSPGFNALRVTDIGGAMTVSWGGVDQFTVTDTTYTGGVVGFGLKGFAATGGFQVDTGRGQDLP